ncbi:MAG: polysaccharide deacetylase family protein [Saprospiraceae bacterium]|nr:polysaccharide deacetylase family protein [Saprospiraceae bacterium]
MIKVVVPNITPRLSYTFDFIFKEVLGVEYAFYIYSPDLENSDEPVIFYLHEPNLQHGIPIFPEGLLFETGLRDNTIEIGHLAEKVIKLTKDEITISHADIFSFIFFCISRYEEYLPHTKDKHGRYLYTESLSFKKDFLERALVDECIILLKKSILKLYPHFNFPTVSGFELFSTVDIDQIWAYANKGWKNIWGCIRDLTRLNIFSFRRRLKAWRNEAVDPFSSYPLIENLHKKNKIKLQFFVLLANKTGKYDKNHDLNEPNFIKKLNLLSESYEMGIHPSYESNRQPHLVLTEKATLENIILKQVIHSRQHFLKVNLPETYYSLIDAGIRVDYSMGYADVIGYKASTGHHFFWYDLKKEQRTTLCIKPFQIMDVTLKNYMHLDAQQAIKRTSSLINYAKSIESPIGIVWHNSSLDEEGDWKGWVAVYEHLLTFSKKK